jgi:hypothetical protein
MKSRKNPEFQYPFDKVGDLRKARIWRTSVHNWMVVYYPEKRYDPWELVEMSVNSKGHLNQWNSAEIVAETKAGLAAKGRKYFKDFKIGAELTS